MNKTPSEMTQQELYLEIARLSNENDKLKRTKKFGLVWENKNDAKVEEVRRSAPILLEDSTKRVINDPNDVNHVLINGDNFQAMTALRATHAGKVDVIYIDPPYNTGNKDFIYNDKFVDAEDGYRHSLWLSFMQKRLILARELLSETGVIFVSIDDNEQARLKLLMDDIFGAQNFIDQIVVKSNNKGRFTNYFLHDHEYVLVFKKGAIQSFAGIRDTEENLYKRFPFVDTDGRRFAKIEWRKRGAASTRKDSPNCFYPFYFSNQDGLTLERVSEDQQEIFPKLSNGDDGRWRGTKETAKGRVLVAHRKPNGEYNINEKMYAKSDNSSMHTILSNSEYSTEFGGLANKKIIDLQFSYPKSHKLVSDLVGLIDKSDAIVLDFFAGSGTTAHAVAELNKADGGRRQCILITDGGKTETSGESSKNAGENTVNIAEEITYERVKRVLTGENWADGKEHEPLGGNLFYLNTVVKYVGTIDAKSKEPYFCPSNSTAFSLDTGLWHPILEEVGVSAEYPHQEHDYKLFALPKSEDGKQNYALTINATDWEFTAFKEWFDKNMPEDSTVFLYADNYSHGGCEWMEELEMAKDPRLAEVNITKRLVNNHNWVAHSCLKTDI